MEICFDPWVSHECEGADLGDKRLTKRFKIILSHLMKKAQENISCAFEHWSQVKSCYRFVNNSKVTPQGLLRPHRLKTLERMMAEPQVLLLHDTTYVDYKYRPQTQGLDIINRSPMSGRINEGLIVHNSLALSTTGVPLGLFDQYFVDRKTIRGRHIVRNACHAQPFQDKESARWLRGIRQFNQVKMTQKVVHIADREADIYELYREAVLIDESFIVRARLDRAINKRSRRQPTQIRLFEFLETLIPQGQHTLMVQVNDEQKYRQAVLNVCYASFTLPPPPSRTVNKDGAILPNLTLWGIIAHEDNPPEGVKELKWMLLTNIPVNSLQEAIEKMTWYSYRWNIELFHKILKSGCCVEKAQLRQASSLKNYIILKSIVAWRLFWITRQFLHNKHAHCESVLTSLESQILYRRFNFGQPPLYPPTFEQVYYWIARLGGYIHRHSKQPPGMISIWKGWTRLQDMINDINAIYGSDK